MIVAKNSIDFSNNWNEINDTKNITKLLSAVLWWGNGPNDQAVRPINYETTSDWIDDVQPQNKTIKSMVTQYTGIRYYTQAVTHLNWETEHSKV